ncbi:MAG: response regulator [Nitrospirae bacterium]|nr:response regulator [Nitrospirota bacterium]
MTKVMRKGRSFKKKVLVAEDNQFVREYIQELFSINGYEVMAVSSASEAIHILGTEYFPVVITELIINDRQGLEILDYIRQRYICTAVIVVTTYREIDLLTRALSMGAYDYINKPFTPHILLHRVAQAVDHIYLQKIISSGSVYTVNDEQCRICRDIHDVTMD